ncbi:ABC transporter substrate-binding protein [Psychromonas hadalis]|uniref:ABC transporter substrate-binding protein n=1 Tax=Psychromonas hadalis TaxID=211669 RepID=UPI0003B77441|nr:ABC transporter substrate-binding protein [Psychromonas hadalis]
MPATIFVFRHLIAFSIPILLVSFLTISLITTVQAREKGLLHIAITLEPPILDPAINASTSIQKITYQNVFEGLTQIDSSNQVQPSLAKRWTIDKTGLIYTFTLQKEVFFHDRTYLTATIVKSSLERMIASNSRNPIKGKFTNIVDITVISKHVIRIKLAWSDGDFLYNLGLGSAVIQHPKSWASNANQPIGTGPYRFVNWKKGDYINLTINHHYWGTLARIENIKIVFAQTRSQVVSYLADGLLDGYSSMTEVGFLDSLFAIRQDYVLKMGNTSGEIIVAMNNANEMLASKSVRQAISHAMNKKVIADTPNFITGAEIGSHYSPNEIAYLDLTNAYPFSLSDAKQLLKASGVAIRPLVLLSPPPTYAQYISLHVQQMLKEIGITVIIEEVSWQEWLTRVYQDKDYDLTVIAHTEPHDLEIYARDDYYFNYKNSEYKNIIAQLNRTHEKSKRAELLKKAQQKLSDDAVNVFLFMLPKVGIWHKALRGYWINESIPAMIFSQMYWQK